MKFKKGDRIRTEDGEAGEILFVDKGGLEAQVALERISIKMRTDTLQMYVPEAASTPTPAPRKASVAKPTRARRRSS